YFPHLQNGLGATTNNGILPTSWFIGPVASKCPSLCFGAGDYGGIASNPYASASTPFVQQYGSNNALFQSFPVDPPDAGNVPNFNANFISFPIGADLTYL